MLKGKQICIRAIREDDLEFLAEQLNDIDSQGEFLPYHLTAPAQLMQQFSANGFISDNSTRLLITEHSGRPLGMVWAFKAIPYFDAVEAGYQIFASDNRGRGYATEALQLLTDYLFNSRQLNRVEVRVATDNLASQKVALKAGFEHEGTHREAAFSKGKLYDMHSYAMLRSQWKAIEAK